MSRLTVTEKEHWKSRIERRINKAIEALEAKDVTLMRTLRQKAEQEAHRLFGTLEMHQKIESLRKKRELLQNEESELETAIQLKALGKKPSEYHADYQRRSDFSRLLDKHRERLEEELLCSTPVGQEISKLRRERDALLDTVWLATSPAQIRELWSRVSDVTGDDATDLQQRILASTEGNTSNA